MITKEHICVACMVFGSLRVNNMISEVQQNSRTISSQNLSAHFPPLVASSYIPHIFYLSVNYRPVCGFTFSVGFQDKNPLKTNSKGFSDNPCVERFYLQLISQ